MLFATQRNIYMLKCVIVRKVGDQMNNIGEKIKVLRKSRKMTQEDFSQKIGVSRSTLSCYEIGQRTPSLKTLQEIAEIFGIGLDYFGLSATDEAFDLLARAKEVFESDKVSIETKEELYHEFMKLYLKIKE